MLSNGFSRASSVIPPLWHLLYFVPKYRPSEMRHDGHAAGGEFMPPIKLPRRMWAGSRFEWNNENPLRVGDSATRISQIGSITPKKGKSGDLVFVKLVHEFRNERGMSFLNEHTSVYRSAATSSDSTTSPISQAPVFPEPIGSLRLTK
jgi:3-methylfumaryl-CoA hydratase